MNYMNFVYDDDLRILDYMQRRSLGGLYDPVRQLRVFKVIGLCDSDIVGNTTGLQIRFDEVEGKDIVVHYPETHSGKITLLILRGHQFVNDENRQNIKDIATDALKAFESLGLDEQSKKLVVGRRDISWMTFEYKGWGDDLLSTVNPKDDRHSLSILDKSLVLLFLTGIILSLAYWKYKTLSP